VWRTCISEPSDKRLVSWGAMYGTIVDIGVGFGAALKIRMLVRLFTGRVSALGRTAFEKITGVRVTFLYLHALASPSYDAFGSCIVLPESPLLTLFNFCLNLLKLGRKLWKRSSLPRFVFPPHASASRPLANEFALAASSRLITFRSSHMCARTRLVALSSPTIMLR
jgi:hypothetical protein